MGNLAHCSFYSRKEARDDNQQKSSRRKMSCGHIDDVSRGHLVPMDVSLSLTSFNDDVIVTTRSDVARV
jgi:hypothetical protein